jgi:hypothetical protein
LNVECDVRILNVTFKKCYIPNLNVTARCKVSVSPMMLGVKVTLKYLNVGLISPDIGLGLGLGLALPPSLGLRLGLGLDLCLCL